jgi:hypothetical protein
LSFSHIYLLASRVPCCFVFHVHLVVTFSPSFHYLLSIQSVPSTPLIGSAILTVLYLLPFRPNSFHMPITCVLFRACNSVILPTAWDSLYQIIRFTPQISMQTSKVNSDYRPYPQKCNTTADIFYIFRVRPAM